jgi:hypothetical protein
VPLREFIRVCWEQKKKKNEKKKMGVMNSHKKKKTCHPHTSDKADHFFGGLSFPSEILPIVKTSHVHRWNDLNKLLPQFREEWASGNHSVEEVGHHLRGHEKESQGVATTIDTKLEQEKKSEERKQKKRKSQEEKIKSWKGRGHE